MHHFLLINKDGVQRVLEERYSSDLAPGPGWCRGLVDSEGPVRSVLSG